MGGLFADLREGWDSLMRDIGVRDEPPSRPPYSPPPLVPLGPVANPNRVRVMEVTPHTTRRVLIEKHSAPYWQERGWTRRGNDYVGFYQTRFEHFEGRIEVSPAGCCAIRINKPSARLRHHPKWVCFHKHKTTWYTIHTVSECYDISSAIIEVERIITESHEHF